MKKQISRVFMSLCLLAVLSSASVEAQSTRRLVVHVPFDFNAGAKTLPAGDYTVRRIVRNSEKALLIQSADGRESVAVLTNAVEGVGAGREKATLQFHQYGEQYFLARVWSTGTGDGRELIKTRRERELERELTARERANDATPKTEARRNIVTVVGQVQ
ncbi:MAG TPA: hypothetical protein VM934_18570 [Pyrinomonadaceae bacterium]|nr:hypothetical protein [Pyrinomonadaceae bacterium]